MKFADLHLHTLYSDGTYSPEELIRQAKKAGLAAIAVTDHDTVEAIPLVIEAAQGEIEIIPGIELTAKYETLEIHILGYFLDYKNEELKQALAGLKENRVERAYKILEKLKELGLDLDPEAVFGIAKGGIVSRLHIARAMCNQGLVGSIPEAFQRYIGDRSPAYVLGFKYSPQEAIALIKDNGGIPILAHPYLLKSDDLILQLIKAGIMGLEVYYPEHTQGMMNFYAELVAKNNLLATGGSDCHGDAKSNIKIGSIKIPYELVEKLKAGLK